MCDQCPNGESVPVDEIDVVGVCFGFKIDEEEYEMNGTKHKHYIVNFCVEDDGLWHFTGASFDGAWATDIRNIAIELVKKMETLRI